jgi:hypothetical protein
MALVRASTWVSRRLACLASRATRSMCWRQAAACAVTAPICRLPATGRHDAAAPQAASSSAAGSRVLRRRGRHSAIKTVPRPRAHEARCVWWDMGELQRVHSPGLGQPAARRGVPRGMPLPGRLTVSLADIGSIAC